MSVCILSEQQRCVAPQTMVVIMDKMGWFFGGMLGGAVALAALAFLWSDDEDESCLEASSQDDETTAVLGEGEDNAAAPVTA